PIRASTLCLQRSIQPDRCRRHYVWHGLLASRVLPRANTHGLQATRATQNAQRHIKPIADLLRNSETNHRSRKNCRVRSPQIRTHYSTDRLDTDATACEFCTWGRWV